MSRHSIPGSSNAIAWALLSQTIWLPLLAIDIHDHWQARVREQQEIAAAAARIRPPAAMASAQTGSESSGSGRASVAPTTGVLLSAAGHGLESASQSLQSAARDLTSRMSGTVAHLTRSEPTQQPSVRDAKPVDTASRIRFRPLTPPDSILSQGFSRSELLGGSLSLSDLHRPPMPALALAEQARWASSGDPLAPLPNLWREPMRKALRSLAVSSGRSATISTARVIHIPSSRVQSPTTVPLAIQGDGSVDILSRADNPSVVDEIRHWSKSQPSRGSGGVTAAIVHLEPMPAAPEVLVPSRSVRSSPTSGLSSPEPAPAASVSSGSSIRRAETPPSSTSATAPAALPSRSEITPPISSAPPAAAPMAVETSAPAPSSVASPAPAPQPVAAAAPASAPEASPTP